MTEQLPSIQATYPPSQSSPDPQEDKPHMNQPSSTDTYHRRVASRRRKHPASKIGNPASPSIYSQSLQDSPPLHSSPPLVSIMAQTPSSHPLANVPGVSPIKSEQRSYDINSQSFHGQSRYRHLPSPDTLTQPHPPPALSQISLFPSMANMTSSLPSAASTTVSLPNPMLTNTTPTVSLPRPIPMLGQESNGEPGGSTLLESSTEEINPASGLGSSSRGLSSDERKQRRLMRNRLAAKECRKKKKAYVTELEDKAQRLENENIRLKQEVEKLVAKLGSPT
ncbi:hypothetical protein K493DRAFT_345336 [Basidiobolus meristosporus CBS 931.73]|uniref:BZIP domain-containing protein n=1 Tax=Basidiobolus meristosporus CBS 931.73 TaxID=1314790 RepID=A0A1Y1Z476_9FUNG|nr:hypothetical protein K493DRAFT_345336 [Basidiobolus meristosporus CBS 931.73]|eukprot:ORY04924.1 hypothetical protein K493DRAFT_345336 [Basidiobolus meristosporus CBS 931.73]